MNLTGKTALVTGSTSGIGLGIAQVLAQAGATLILNGFGDVEAAKDAVAQYGNTPGYHGADLSDEAQIADMMRYAESEFGGVDILVNNAGIQRRRPFLEFPEQDWNDVIAVNQTAVFLVSQTVAKKWSIASAVKSSISVRCKANWAATPSRLTPLPKVPSPC